MRPISSRADDEVMVAEEQHEFRTCPATPYQDGGAPAWLVRWTFTPDERRRIAAGEDIALSLAGQQLTPHRVSLFTDFAP